MACRPQIALQAGILKILSKHVYSDWPSLVHRRLSAVCVDYNGNIQSAVAILEPRLRNLSPTRRAAIVKTASNSWCTSHRYHEQHIHNCILRCGSVHPCLPNVTFSDSLPHYLIWPSLWGFVIGTTGLPVGSSASSRVGVSMEWLDLRHVALAHHTYHSFKRDHDGTLGLHHL